MKKLFLIALLASAFSVSAQTANELPLPKLSASTRLYLHKTRTQLPSAQNPMEEFVYKMNAQNQVFVSAMIHVHPSFNANELTQLGVMMGTKAGSVWVVHIPVQSVGAVTQLHGINYIDLDSPAAPDMDTARKMTKTTLVHEGFWLPQAYTGTGVVMGVIDAGFDYTHPTLYDTAYNAYRVKRVWEEKNTTGPAPAGFSFGTEFTDSLSIVTQAYDNYLGTHGTHVAGIAAGSGYGGPAGNNERYRGMAYTSEMVLVGIYPTPAHWLNTGSTDFIDGINYVFDYAASVSKPAVANLSWGCPLGPRDGTSLFSQALNSTVGPGKIFVLSGGNNGTNNIHISKAFTAADTALKTISTFSTGLTEKRNWLDIWGDTAQTFCMQFSIHNSVNQLDITPLICLDDTTHEFFLIGSNNDTCFITITTVLSEFNMKPHMLVQLYSRIASADKLCVTITATSGKVDMWQGYVLNSSGYYGSFVPSGYTWASLGNSQMTCSDLVSSAKAIGVGAYNSKPTFTNVSGSTLTYTGFTKGALSSFSSRGPTADMRTKPNITAPGLALASGISSVDSGYISGGPNYNSVVSLFTSPLNGKTYSYGVAVGTSMAGPCVAGIVALMLQADPTLDPNQVMSILYQTAIQDNFTGVIPANGSNAWGYGKVNAWQAIVQVLGLTGIHHYENNALQCLVYPNPGNGIYTLDYASNVAENAEMNITDVAGKIVYSDTWNATVGHTLRTIDLHSMPAGMYMATIQSVSGNAVIKIIKK